MPELTASYSSKRFGWGMLDEEIDQVVGASFRTGRGTILTTGEREIFYEFESVSVMKRAKDRLRKHFGRRIRVKSRTDEQIERDIAKMRVLWKQKRRRRKNRT